MVKHAKNGTKISPVKQEEAALSPAVGAVIGAAAGAVVGSIIVKLMSDEKNRIKAGRLLDKSMEVLKEINEQPKGFQSLAEDSINEAASKTKKFLQGK